MNSTIEHQTSDVIAQDKTGVNKHEAKENKAQMPQSSGDVSQSSSNNSQSSLDLSSSQQGGTKRSSEEANDTHDDNLSTTPASTETSPASSTSTGHVHKRQRSDASAERSISTGSGASSEPAPLDRPVCSGKPPVWAENRTDLCETLPYYQAFRSAAYTLDGYVRGLMLDKDEGGREYVGTEVLIVRGGGGMGMTPDGRRDHTKDHSRKDSTAVAFLNNMKHNVPINIVLGNKNKAAPSVIPHRYCVLDYFRVTDTWCERVSGFIVIFYRLEKLLLDKKSWWAPVGSPETSTTRDFEAKALRQHCVTCATSSPQVYHQGWMCLNSDCSVFWTPNGDAAPINLTYNSAFLNERSRSENPAPPYLLKPDSGNLCFSNAAGITVSKAATKGVVCENCNRCIPRKYWNAWKCTTPGCGYVLQAPRDVLSASQVRTNLANTFEGPALSMDKCDDSIQVDVERHGLYRLHRYHLSPGNTVTHIFSCETLNSTIGGPNELFMGLQKADLGLQRFEMSQSMSPGQLVAHFSSNSGLPYKYVVAVDSKAFADVPPELLNVLKRGSWAAKLAVPGQQDLAPFNEILTVGYLESDKMGYHDDGEATVGPTVVSLSLGGDSEMKFRMKPKFYYGIPKGDGAARKNNPKLPIIPGCAKPDERRRLNALARTCTPAQLAKEAKGVFADCKATPPPLLNLKLAHGDIVVQHGKELQAHYEHCAVPSDKLRFALTARHIKPEGVAQEDLWKGELPAGFDDPTNAYDGDMALYEQYVARLR